jgi:hypothetical protein
MPSVLSAENAVRAPSHPPCRTVGGGATGRWVVIYKHVAMKFVTYDSQGRGYRLYLDRAALQVFRGEVTHLVMRELQRVPEEEWQARRHLDRPGPRQLFRTVADFLARLQRQRQKAEMERLQEARRQADHEGGGSDR